MTAVISGLTVANGKVINSAAGGGIYIDTGGTLTLTDSTLSGNSSSGGSASSGGGIASLGTLTIANSTLSGNSANGGSFGNSGGGIFNNTGATLTIINSTLSGNSASGGPGGNGGAIQNSGTLTITNSTLSGNSADSGGAILNTGTASVTNSTLSGNLASSFGGGITSGGGSTTLTITNSTLSGNSVSGGSGQGGGIFNGGTANIRSTIIAQNTAASGPDFQGTLTSQGHNLIGDTNGATITGETTGNILNQNPLLGPLQNNGGPTQTMALLPGSPAINAGDNAAITDPPFAGPEFTDQRGAGFDRIVDTTVDIGAFESRGFTIATTSGTPQSATFNTAFANPLVATVSSTFGEPVDGGEVTFTAPGAGASATFTGGVTTIKITIDAVARRSATATANATAVGPYNVTAAGNGISGHGRFQSDEHQGEPDDHVRRVGGQDFWRCGFHGERNAPRRYWR